MKRFAFMLWAVLLITEITAFPQCNQLLVEKAAEKAGSDAIYIRDFKVKLSKGDMENPSPTGKFPVYLNKGVNYRFTIANAEEYQGKALVELVKRGQTYSGNYNFDTKEYLNSFDFECTQSSTYQVILSFGEGKEGCAAIVMSMIFQDSMSYIEPGIAAKSDSNEVLYLWTENKLQIASSAGKNAEIQVSISQGKLKKQAGHYLIQPDTLGNLIVKAHVYLENKLVENDSVFYQVEIPPFPMVMLPGEVYGSLSIRNFNVLGEIQLTYPFELESKPYILKTFSISADKNGFIDYLSDKDRLSPQQINFLKKLKPNDSFYITNTIFIDPEGKEHHADSRRVIIVE